MRTPLLALIGSASIGLVAVAAQQGRPGPPAPNADALPAIGVQRVQGNVYMLTGA